jgi:hypothetical protein
VLPAGRLVHVQTVGAWLREDDQLVIDMCQHREAQWRVAQVGACRANQVVVVHTSPLASPR